MKKLILALGLIIAVALTAIVLMGSPAMEKGRTRDSFVEVYRYGDKEYLLFKGIDRRFPPFVLEVK